MSQERQFDLDAMLALVGHRIELESVNFFGQLSGELRIGVDGGTRDQPFFMRSHGPIDAQTGVLGPNNNDR